MVSTSAAIWLLTVILPLPLVVLASLPLPAATSIPIVNESSSVVSNGFEGNGSLSLNDDQARTELGHAAVKHRAGAASITRPVKSTTVHVEPELGLWMPILVTLLFFFITGVSVWCILRQKAIRDLILEEIKSQEMWDVSHDSDVSPTLKRVMSFTSPDAVSPPANIRSIDEDITVITVPQKRSVEVVRNDNDESVIASLGSIKKKADAAPLTGEPEIAGSMLPKSAPPHGDEAKRETVMKSLVAQEKKTPKIAKEKYGPKIPASEVCTLVGLKHAQKLKEQKIIAGASKKPYAQSVQGRGAATGSKGIAKVSQKFDRQPHKSDASMPKLAAKQQIAAANGKVAGEQKPTEQQWMQLMEEVIKKQAYPQ